MKNADDIERAVRLIRVETTPGADERILAAARAALDKKEKRTVLYWPRLLIRRTIMRNRWTKLTSVAAAALAMAVIAGLWGTPSTVAYGIEDTVKAYSGVRYVRVKELSPPSESACERWLEFDHKGSLIWVRQEEGVGDHFRIMVSGPKGVKFYRPSSGEFLVLPISPQQARGELDRSRETFDPRYAIERIYKLEKEGKVTIDVEKPSGASEPIIVTATHATGEAPDGKGGTSVYTIREVLHIDSKTKLVTEKEKYVKLGDADFDLRGRYQYFDHDKPIDAEMFDLEAPDGVEVEDLRRGMPQGDMSDVEAAREVVRQYLEALVAKDYKKAAGLYGHQREEDMRGRSNVVRVVEVGEAEPYEERGERAYFVKFTYEIEGGELIGPPSKSKESGPQTHRKAMVTPVPGKEDHWMVAGGI